MLCCSLLLALAVPAAAQELDCNVTIDMEQLTSEARENLAEFVSQIRQYMNGYHWTKEGIDGDKIQCTVQIKFVGASSENHYTAQAFIGSQRQIYRLGKNSAMLRVLDEKWEFQYIRNQSLNHDEYRFDPLLSFLDFYGNLIIGYEFDSYKPSDGTQFFQKALDIVNKSRSAGSAGAGWEASPRATFSRGQLVDELLNPKFEDFREAVFQYHFKGLDLLYKNGVKARKNVLSSMEMIAKVLEKVNQNSLAIRLFFDTKAPEIADVFKDDPDRETILTRLGKIDPAHQSDYDETLSKGK
jgi:hypothetical protein